uniref:THO complex subunit 1 n=1 Tax=Panagrellus redivivus TaxID=6233 RepID=A0A7E4VBI7_PANRE
MELPDVTTFQEFLSTVHYAWEYPQENLKMKCAKFWQENKDVVKEKPEYQLLPRTIQASLTILGCCVEQKLEDSLLKLKINEASPNNPGEISKENTATNEVDLKFELVTQV